MCTGKFVQEGRRRLHKRSFQLRAKEAPAVLPCKSRTRFNGAAEPAACTDLNLYAYAKLCKCMLMHTSAYKCMHNDNVNDNDNVNVNDNVIVNVSEQRCCK